MNRDANSYPDTHSYLEALAEDPSLAIISKKMAGEALGLGSPAIAARIKAGKLPTVKIGGVRHVRAQALIERQESSREKVSMVREYLEHLAARREFEFYDPVMNVIGLSSINPHHRREIGEILGTISEETFAEYGVMLSVLVHRNTKGVTRPSPAFFWLASKLGYEYEDEDEFVSEEMKRVWLHYAPKPSGKRRR